MEDPNRCPGCGAAIPPGRLCDRCASLLAGSRPIAVEPLRQEAALVFDLLESAGLHPILAFHDESGAPHPIDPEGPFSEGEGLMVPVMTTFAVYVPEGEAEDSRRILDDARHAADEAEA